MVAGARGPGAGAWMLPQGRAKLAVVLIAVPAATYLAARVAAGQLAEDAAEEVRKACYDRMVRADAELAKEMGVLRAKADALQTRAAAAEAALGTARDRVGAAEEARASAEKALSAAQDRAGAAEEARDAALKARATAAAPPGGAAARADGGWAPWGGVLDTGPDDCPGFPDHPIRHGATGARLLRCAGLWQDAFLAREGPVPGHHVLYTAGSYGHGLADMLGQMVAAFHHAVEAGVPFFFTDRRGWSSGDNATHAIDAPFDWHFRRHGARLDASLRVSATEGRIEGPHYPLPRVGDTGVDRFGQAIMRVIYRPAARVRAAIAAMLDPLYERVGEAKPLMVCAHIRRYMIYNVLKVRDIGAGLDIFARCYTGVLRQLGVGPGSLPPVTLGGTTPGAGPWGGWQGGQRERRPVLFVASDDWHPDTSKLPKGADPTFQGTADTVTALRERLGDRHTVVSHKGNPHLAGAGPFVGGFVDFFTISDHCDVVLETATSTWKFGAVRGGIPSYRYEFLGNLSEVPGWCTQQT